MLPAFVLHDFHVVEASSIESVVHYSTPEITPHFIRSNQQRGDDSSLLFNQKFQSVFVVQMSKRVDREVTRAFLQQAIIPEEKFLLEKNAILINDLY